MGSKKCEVCEEAQSKYKCPSCLVPYCSLAYFKKHKANTVLPEKPQEVDDPSCVLSNKQLQCIADSHEIRGFLEDVKLWKLIQKIDSCKDPENELDKPMEGQVFRQFTDKLKGLAFDVHLEVRPEAMWVTGYDAIMKSQELAQSCS